MNDHLPKSKIGLRMNVLLLEVANLGLRESLKDKNEEIKALEKAHEYFIEWIQSPKNYKQWLRDQLANEPQLIKVA